LDFSAGVVDPSGQPANLSVGTLDLILGPGIMAAACITGWPGTGAEASDGAFGQGPQLTDSTSQPSPAQHSQKNERAEQSEQSRAGQDRTGQSRAEQSVTSGEPRPEAELAGCKTGSSRVVCLLLTVQKLWHLPPIISASLHLPSRTDIVPAHRSIAWQPGSLAARQPPCLCCKAVHGADADADVPFGPNCDSISASSREEGDRQCC
jgi:hypothetical protein